MEGRASRQAHTPCFSAFPEVGARSLGTGTSWVSPSVPRPILPLGLLVLAQKQSLALFSASEPLGLSLLLFTVALALNQGLGPPAAGEKLSLRQIDSWNQWGKGPAVGKAELLG